MKSLDLLKNSRRHLEKEWERFKEMLRQCPHHGFSELQQINTFYNGLSEHEQYFLNVVAGENLLRKTPQDALIIIETNRKIDKLTDTISNLVETFNKKMTTPATMKAVEETYVICGGAHPYYDCIATDSNISSVCATTGNHHLKCVSYDGPPILLPTSSLPNAVERVPEVTKDMVQPSTENIQPPVAQTQVPIEPVVASKPKPTIPYPSRANKQKLRKKDDILALKFVEIFRNLHFELSFADALLHMPKFALMFKNLLNNKEKLFDLATTLVNENCSAVTLKKLPEKLGDLGKFFIPCVFPEFDECLALADLVVDYVVDPRVPLILGRPFLRTGRALIDVYGEELTLRVDDEAITFNVRQTSKYSYDDPESINRSDVIDVACKEYVQEVLGFSDNSKSGSSTPTSDLIISSSSPSFTPFEGSDFILEEIKTFLQTPNELSNSDDDYYDMKGDILYLEKLLNEDPSPSLPPVKTKDLKQVNATMTKPSIEEAPELKLKELPSHLEYAFLEGTDKLPVIISKELQDEENPPF
nr:reverse transcriptase domain-containing protein [Tanacetum cinerariifolium]